MNGPSVQSPPRTIRPTHQFVLWGHLAILRYARTTGIEAVVDLEEFSASIQSSHAGAVFPCLTIIEDGVAPPSAEQRRRLSAIWTTFAPVIQGISYALPGTGFGAATRRAVITGLQLLARNPFPVHVASDVESAAAWLCQRFPSPEWTVEGVAQAVRDLAGAAPAA